jgi:galactitol-specific phosphotransferase system IIB component
MAMRGIMKLKLSITILLYAAMTSAQAPSSISGPARAPVTKGSSITIKGSDFEVIRSSLKKLAENHNGRVTDSKTNVSSKGRKFGWFRLIVPAVELDSTMVDVRKVGKLIGEYTTSAPRQSELDELSLRSQSLNAHVNRLKSGLNDGRKLRGSDILYLQERVFRGETDVKLLRHESDKILSQIDNASIVVTAYEAGRM